LLQEHENKEATLTVVINMGNLLLDRKFNLYYNCKLLLISIKFPIKLFKRSKVIYHQAGNTRGQRGGLL